MTNKNYGKIINGKIEYAPSSFKIDSGLIMNPTESMYLKRGWYRVIDEKPEPDPNCAVKFKDYTIDDENKTIAFNYVQQMIPIVRETKIYSKLKLESAIFQIGRINAFDNFLDQTPLSNQFGEEMPLRRFYDQANDLRNDNEYFETYYALAREALDLDLSSAEAILSNCLMEY